MRKKLIAIFVIFVGLLIIPIAASASSYGFKQGDYVVLNGYRFIVLDPANNYLYADFNLENRSFSTTVKNFFDPNDTNNIAYYLNKTFLNNLGDLSSHIKEHNWTTGNEQNESSRMAEAKIGLLSYSEWKKFSRKYSNGLLPNPSVNTLIRTQNSIRKNYNWIVINDGSLASGFVTSNTSAATPSLYLNDGLNKSGLGTKTNPYLMAEEKVVLSDISDLSLLNTGISEIVLSWRNPIESSFSHLNVYKNDILVEKNYKMEGYTFKGLNPSQEYKITIKAVDKYGEETEGITILVSTDSIPLIPEINNLKAVTTYERVNLSWLNPNSDFFKKVRIYRKLEQKELSSFEKKGFNLFQPLKVEAAETKDFKPMFETNGTYWNDLTVDPSTTYSYKLTTVNIADLESTGTVIQATTLGTPLPEIEGGGYEENEDGDFLFTWTSPTTGQVKVLIDGKDYKTVDASLKQILIPKEDMKYDIFNNPKVTLVPISEDGKEGTPTKPGEGGGSGEIGGTKMPFGPTDLLTSTIGLLGVIAPILLLSLALIFFRPIKNLIVKAVQTHRERKMYR